jgi:hypothetical protein
LLINVGGQSVAKLLQLHKIPSSQEFSLSMKQHSLMAGCATEDVVEKLFVACSQQRMIGDECLGVR